jgi:hypothetical protein
VYGGAKYLAVVPQLIPRPIAPGGGGSYIVRRVASLYRVSLFRARNLRHDGVVGAIYP